MTITGVLKVTGLPDDICITSTRDFVLALANLLAVEFQESRITNVYVSAVEPDTTARDIIWYRLDNSGNFVGVFIFARGQWIQQFPVPGQVFRIVGGRSDQPPPGFILADENVSNITTDEAKHLKSSWFPVPEDIDDPDTYPDYFTVFDVVYVGL